MQHQQEEKEKEKEKKRVFFKSLKFAKNIRGQWEKIVAHYVRHDRTYIESDWGEHETILQVRGEQDQVFRAPCYDKWVDVLDHLRRLILNVVEVIILNADWQTFTEHGPNVPYCNLSSANWKMFVDLFTCPKYLVSIKFILYD